MPGEILYPVATTLILSLLAGLGWVGQYLVRITLKDFLASLTTKVDSLISKVDYLSVDMTELKADVLYLKNNGQDIKERLRQDRREIDSLREHVKDIERRFRG